MKSCLSAWQLKRLSHGEKGRPGSAGPLSQDAHTILPLLYHGDRGELVGIDLPKLDSRAYRHL